MLAAPMTRHGCTSGANRDWDISGQERFDLLRDYVHCGLEHWGADAHGVNATRRFLLEWLSYLHR